MSTNSFSTPPTTPNLTPTVTPSSWPTVLGVLGLVLGILGSLGYFCGALWPAIAPWVQQHMPSSSAAEIPPTPTTSVVIACVNLVLSILLCVAATRLLQRRAAAVKLWRTWAWLKIVSAVVGTVLSIPIQIESMRHAAEQTPQTTQPSPMADQMLMTLAVINGGIVLLVFLALPIFALIWFNRQKIRQQTALWP